MTTTTTTTTTTVHPNRRLPIVICQGRSGKNCRIITLALAFWRYEIRISMPLWSKIEIKTQRKKPSNNSLSHERGIERSERANEPTSERCGTREHSEQGEAREWVSGASEGANGRASGPVLQSLFLAVLDHSTALSDATLLVRNQINGIGEKRYLSANFFDRIRYLTSLIQNILDQFFDKRGSVKEWESRNFGMMIQPNCRSSAHWQWWVIAESYLAFAGRAPARGISIGSMIGSLFAKRACRFLKSVIVLDLSMGLSKGSLRKMK